jgi:hypothetical protein
MDARCVARRATDARTAKSCGPGAPGLALSLAGDLRGDGDYEVTDTGESTEQPLTPSRREGRSLRLNLW